MYNINYYSFNDKINKYDTYMMAVALWLLQCFFFSSSFSRRGELGVIL